jgi:PAS domain S-box-containing protein
MELTRSENRPRKTSEPDTFVSEQVSLLYGGLPSSIAAHLLLSLLVAFVLRNAAGQGRLAGWLASIFLMVAARGGLYLRWRADAGGHPDAWLFRFRVGAAAGGVVWALLPLLPFPSDLPHLLFVAFVISGITAGAVTSLALDRESALLFVVPPLLLLIVRLLSSAGEISVVMAMMTLAFLAFISLSAVRAFQGARESAALRVQAVASARRLSEAQRIARLGDWELDVATGRLTWSDTVYEIFGRDPANFHPDVEKYYAELVHPDDAAALRKEEQAAYASGRVHRNDHRILMPDGSERAVHLEGIAEVDRDGRPLKIRGIVQDITERKRMEETLRRFNAELERRVDERTGELRQSEERLRCVTNSLNEGLLLTDLNDVITDVNPKMLEMTGYTREELVGRSASAILLAPEEQQLRRERNGRREVDQAGEYEQRLRRKDGSTFWAQIIGSPLRDINGAVIGAVEANLDITERKRAETKLLELNEELIRSNKELEQFAYVASHDLQEPLRMVSSYTQLLARRYQDKLDHEAREFIHYAVDGANRMHNLIQALLSYSRISTRGAQMNTPVDLREAMEEAVAHLRVAISESAAKVTAAGLPTVAADRTQMVQLFQNLIGNSIKFRKHEEPPRVQISAEKTGHEWIISVKDNGIGIEPQYFERIFVIFQRLHGTRQYPGTGIGLALCQRIVQRHSGRIWVESEPGQGATFHFTINGT